MEKNLEKIYLNYLAVYLKLTQYYKSIIYTRSYTTVYTMCINYNLIKKITVCFLPCNWT